MPRSRAAIAALPLLAALALGPAGSSATSSARNGRIAYAHLGASGNLSQIYTTTTTGTHRRRLTGRRRVSNLAPAFAPNGKHIVFVRAWTQGDLWTMHSDGSRKRRLTWTTKIDELAPAWAPDGKQIAFAVDRPRAQEGVWVIRSTGHGRRRLTSGPDSHPTWSPDGSKIAFQRYDGATQADAILVVAATGGAATELTDDPSYSDLEPAWSPTGNRILFTSDRGDDPDGAEQLDLWAMNANGSDVARVTNTPSRDERDPAWSPDGRRIAYSGAGTFHGASSSQIYVSDANGTHRSVLTHACGECAVSNDDPSWQPLPR